jgi:YVTN family beta-propeller protein
MTRGWLLPAHGVGPLAAAALLAVLAAPIGVHAQPSALNEFVLFGTEHVHVGRETIVTGGDIGSSGVVAVRSKANVPAGVRVAADTVAVAPTAQFAAAVFPAPSLILPPPLTVAPGATVVTAGRGETVMLAAGAFGRVEAKAGSTLVFEGGVYHLDSLRVRGSGRRPSVVRCESPGGCVVRVLSQLILGANGIGLSGGPLTFHFAGTRPVSLGRRGAQIRASVHAPLAIVRLRSSSSAAASYSGRYAARQVRVGTAATVGLDPLSSPICGNNVSEPPSEECDGADDSACPGFCDAQCRCIPAPGTTATLHAIGPSVLNNATAFGVQIFGDDFLPGAELELSDQLTGTILASLPTSWVSYTEMTALVPAGMEVPSGIERELVARVINPGAAKSAPPDIGHCEIDRPNSPIACTSDADCPPAAGTCVNGIQRLTMFNDLAFLNPNSAAVVPPPAGLCDDGSLCTSAAACAGIGGGACSEKLYVTPQQRDEVWVFNTGTGQFVDRNPGLAGIQGIPVGDNPFHLEVLDAGRVWVVNRFDDSFSIIDTATDTELARVTGAALGAPGRLRMETEIEFNRARTRAYLSNENTDEVQVLDIAGVKRDAPELIASIDVGVNPRGMATDTADTRLYVANIQSADVSVVDIEPGSATENQVIATLAARATDDIVGGRADGWEPFVIGGRAPRGIAFSDAHQAVFVTSIGPQTGPRAGVGQVGGAIISPTVTVIDAMTDSVVAHVALIIGDPDRPTCTDPELMALDDARGRLYITCQGSGAVDVVDTADLVAAVDAELAIVPLPLPGDAPVPTLNLAPAVGAFGAKVCSAATTNPGTPCSSAADCTGCPPTVDGLPVVCCVMNNPDSVHNGPRGVALASDADTLYVVNQFTTSVTRLDVSPSDPALIGVLGTTSFPGAFGTDVAQRDRRLGQIEFFSDVRKTGVSCATCHIDDHQDGVFFEADVQGPRLRRVLSVRSTRDFPPLLQDQLVPDLLSFTDIVVHAERGGALPCIPCVEIFGVPFCSGSGGTECTQTSDEENLQNALYAKAITFFPNPNLSSDGSFSSTVPLPGGMTGDALRGADVFDALACQSCHPEPLFTIDQLRSLDAATLGQPVRMREVGTPVFIPLRAKCQDAVRPTGTDGSAGFTVPTLRGIWDTFPLLLSGAAGLDAIGPEPVFSVGCAPGSAGCCAELQSPINPGGIPVPPQHLAVTTKDAIRAVLTAPLAVPGSGHGAALGLSPSDLNALIAYIRSL